MLFGRDLYLVLYRFMNKIGVQVQSLNYNMLTATKAEIGFGFSGMDEKSDHNSKYISLCGQ